MNTTVIYLTDNSLDEDLAVKVRSILIKNSPCPIVSVSQRPINLGKNVCLGEIGRSWMSLYKGILAGIDAAETDYISIAEHDCLYSPEHFNWMPTTDDVFYYNENCWLVQWGGNHPELNGMYSYWKKRSALSQLVCHKALLKKTIEEIVSLLDMGLCVKKGLRWKGEPGVTSDEMKEYCRRAFNDSVSGQPNQLQRNLKKYVTTYKSEFFKTELPNIDIRHGSNFTGPKRGNNRCYELPYWGKFAEVMNA